MLGANKTCQELAKNKKSNPIITAARVFLIGILFLLLANPAGAAVNSDELINLVNKERVLHNLKPLSVSPLLTRAAENKAKDLINKNYFAHADPHGKNFSEWILEAGYKYYLAGENLAINFKSNNDAVRAWLKSPGHRFNLLNSYYTETGTAVIFGKFNNKDTAVVVQLFGLPANNKYAAVDEADYANLSFEQGMVLGSYSVASSKTARFINLTANILSVIILFMIIIWFGQNLIEKIIYLKLRKQKIPIQLTMDNYLKMKR